MTSQALPSPYDSPELYDLLFEPFDFDASYWLEAARAAGGPVLEVGCGTGRIQLRLSRSRLGRGGTRFERAHARSAPRESGGQGP